MAAGEIWYLDFNQPHSVVNRGKSERVHLVIDVCVNDWLTERFIEALNDVAESRDIEG
jgi:hypothetical protein